MVMRICSTFGALQQEQKRREWTVFARVNQKFFFEDTRRIAGLKHVIFIYNRKMC